MPRIPRRFDEGATYHVYNRFSRGEPIFEEAAEVVRFERMDGALAKTKGWEPR